MEESDGGQTRDMHIHEIGKRGIQSREEFAQRRLNGMYHVYDLGDDMKDEPKKVQRMLKGVADDMERGVLKAINERVYSLRKAKEAYQYMFEGKHVGKIVFEHPIEVRDLNDGIVVMSGGFGGLGEVYSEKMESKAMEKRCKECGGVRSVRCCEGRRHRSSGEDW